MTTRSQMYSASTDRCQSVEGSEKDELQNLQERLDSKIRVRAFPIVVPALDPFIL